MTPIPEITFNDKVFEHCVWSFGRQATKTLSPAEGNIDVMI